MKLFGMKGEYNIGVEDLDAQRMKIMALIKKLFEIIRGECKEYNFKDVFNTLIKYLEDYFSNEEKLMLKTKFSHYEKHSNQHIDCVKKLQMFGSNYSKGNKDSAAELQRFITKWFASHTENSDKRFVEYLRLKLKS